MSVYKLFRRYPVIRGMATYVFLYPSSNAVQQVLEKKPFDLRESARFAVFGSLWVAPTLYTWIKLAGFILPSSTLAASVFKALLEQVIYSPFAITTFYAGMNLLQGNFDWNHIRQEWKMKFVPTYTAGLFYWPIVQTVNFGWVRESYRVPVVSAASFGWVTFLSYMKRREVTKEGRS